jgi:hypothetical protein
MDRGRQFLADKENIAMLRNTSRQTGQDGVVKSESLSGLKALIRNNNDKAFYAFVDKADLIKRLEQSPKIAPYIKDAVIGMNDNYKARSERLRTQSQSVSNER